MLRYGIYDDLIIGYETLINDIETPTPRKMSQAPPMCVYNGCQNIGMATSQCAECDEHFCDDHMKAHITEHTDKP